MVQFEDRDYGGELEEDDGLLSSDILVRNPYFSSGVKMDITRQGIAPGGRAQLRYKYNGMELNKGSRLLDKGFRYYDPGIGRFTGASLGIACDNEMDPCHLGRQALAEEAPSLTSYSYGFNNPLRFIDKDGRYEFPVEFQRKYPMFTAYLQNHVRNDVIGSKTILNAFSRHTAADSPTGVGNLNRQAIETAVTWDSGPKIIIRDNPGGLSGAEGNYNSSTRNIELSKSRIDHLESVLAG
jgi:RHS repeat-associated protein